MNFVEFGKPLDLVNIDGKRLSKVVIDELEHKWGELPTFNGHFLDLGFIERNPKRCHPTDKIKKVIFNAPATIVIWADGTKTVVKCQHNDEYNAEIGLLMCIAKKHFGNTGNFNEVFKKWVADYKDPARKLSLVYYTKSECFDENNSAGIIGTPTPLKTDKGEALFIGDIVHCKTEYHSCTAPVVSARDGEPFIMGLRGEKFDIPGKPSRWHVERVTKYSELKVGEIYYDFTVCEE